MASAVQAKQVLRVGLSVIPFSLDPATTIDGGTSSIVRGLFEGLVRLDERGQAVPAMAKSWKISADGKIYTFTLRSGVKWSNGQAVKAADFEYAWKRALAPATFSSRAFRMYSIAGAQAYHEGKVKDASKVGIKALNDSTLQVTLSEKTAYFTQLLADDVYMPVPAQTVKKDSEWGRSMKTMVTNGPFKLKQWTGSAITLSKNTAYYLAKDIRLTEVQLLTPKSGTESTTEAYLNNEVDWAGGTESIQYSALDQESAKALKAFPLGGTFYYQFNPNKAPFHNLKIRKALAMALDRELFGGIPAYGLIPYGVRGAKLDYRSEISDEGYISEDIAQAKRLLQEGLKEEGLTKLPSFKISLNEGYDHTQVAMIVISSWIKNLGVEAEIELLTWEDQLANRYSGNYTVARGGWSADFNDPANFMEFLTSASPENNTSWHNKQYDAYVQQARHTDKVQERMALYGKAEKLLMDEMVLLPLFYNFTHVLHKPNLNGVYVNFDRTINFTRGYFN